MRVLTGREASIFACLTDAVVATAPPLPPVAATDAAASFDAWLARAPRPNRVAFRAVLYALEAGPRALGFGARMRGLDGAARLDYLAALDRSPARPLVEALRSAVSVAYYGDLGVLRLLGYDPAERTRP